MNILWLTWKDLKNPLSGGAELVNEELCKRLVIDGHSVTMITAGFAGSCPEEQIDGYRIIRVGNRWTVYWRAYRSYLAQFIGWADLVIDEINTIPFFANFYVKEKKVLFIHMLCRDIWFYQLPRMIGWVGYLLEPIYLKLLSDHTVVTVSESTRSDLTKYGFQPEKIHIISEGIRTTPVRGLAKMIKFSSITLLSLGAMRPMKQTLDQVKAYELAREKISSLRLKIAGDASGQYGERVLAYIGRSRHADGIEYLGKVSEQKKQQLLQRCHLLMVTSVKEGWGLTVTEAASQGTPSIVYNVDGLRDSVRHQNTGVVCSLNTPTALARAIVAVCKNPNEYEKYRKNGWEWSKQITFDQSYEDFMEVIGARKEAYEEPAQRFT